MHTAEPLHRLPTAPPSLTSNQTPCRRGSSSQLLREPQQAPLTRAPIQLKLIANKPTTKSSPKRKHYLHLCLHHQRRFYTIMQSPVFCKHPTSQKDLSFFMQNPSALSTIVLARSTTPPPGQLPAHHNEFKPAISRLTRIQQEALKGPSPHPRPHFYP